MKDITNFTSVIKTTESLRESFGVELRNDPKTFFEGV
jgi:hypothetical protein